MKQRNFKSKGTNKVSEDEIVQSFETYININLTEKMAERFIAGPPEYEMRISWSSVAFRPIDSIEVILKKLFGKQGKYFHIFKHLTKKIAV